MFSKRGVSDHLHSDCIPVHKSLQTLTELLVFLLILNHVLHFLRDEFSDLSFLFFAPLKAIFADFQVH